MSSEAKPECHSYWESILRICVMYPCLFLTCAITVKYCTNNEVPEMTISVENFQASGLIGVSQTLGSMSPCLNWVSFHMALTLVWIYTLYLRT